MQEKMDYVLHKLSLTHWLEINCIFQNYSCVFMCFTNLTVAGLRDANDFPM